MELSLPDDRVPSNAVAEGMDISDIYDEAPADTSGYNVSMGISTGDYYAAKIKGGTLFTGFSGGHDPYSSLQGQITINADKNLIAKDGTINTDLTVLGNTVLTERPGRFGWAERNTDENGSPVAANDYSRLHAKLALNQDAIDAYEKENGDTTVTTTANSSGSLLVTDSGGGIIVANKFSGVAYSTGSSGVYSMGGGSYVYVYNSRLESHIEPVLNSVGECLQHSGVWPCWHSLQRW